MKAQGMGPPRRSGNTRKLYSFAKENYITIHEANRMEEHLHNCFHFPLSEEAYIQLLVVLRDTLNRLELQESHDTWTYTGL